MLRSLRRFSIMAEAAEAVATENTTAKIIKPKRLPPTHFLSVRVTSPLVLAVFDTVQSSIKASAASHFSKSLVEPITSHITIGVLSLPTDEKLTQATEALREADTILHDHQLLHPFDITLQGLDHFRDSVLYLSVAQNEGLERLEKLAEILRQHFIEKGVVDIESNKDFTPHITIAKTSKLFGGSGRGGGKQKNKWRSQKNKNKLENNTSTPTATTTTTTTIDPQQQEEQRNEDTTTIIQQNQQVDNATATATGNSNNNDNDKQEQHVVVSKQLPRACWQEFEDIDGGVVTVDEIQLCSMIGRESGQFYKVVETLKLIDGNDDVGVVQLSGSV